MDHKVSKDMISSGMIPSGEKTQADLSRTQYGTAPSPSKLMDAYKSMYDKKEEVINEHHQKDKDGNTIPHEGEELNELKSRTMLDYIDKASDSASNQINKAKKFESKGKLKKAAKARLKMEKRESGIAMAKDKILKRQEDKTLTSLKRSYDGPDAVREEKKVMGKIKKSFRRDEFGDPIKLDGSYAGKPNPDKNPKDEKITHSNSYQPDMSMVEAKDLTGNFDKGKKPIKVNLKDLVNKAKNNPKNKNLGVKPPTDTEDVTEAKSAAWQRKAGKSESGGLNAKGVASYRAANPGSKLKTAVTTKPSKLKKGSKSAKRRLSFCRRMKGCLLYTSPSPRDATLSRMPSSA